MENSVHACSIHLLQFWGGEGRVVAPIAEGFSSVDFGYLHPLKTASWSSVACRGPQWPRLWVSAVVARAPRVLLLPFSSARGSHGQGDPSWCWGSGQRRGQSSSRVKVWGVGTCSLAVAPGSLFQTFLCVSFLFSFPVTLQSMGLRNDGIGNDSLTDGDIATAFCP